MRVRLRNEKKKVRLILFQKGRKFDYNKIKRKKVWQYSIQKEESSTTWKSKGKKFNYVFKEKKKVRPLKVNRKKVRLSKFQKENSSTAKS